MKLYAAGAEPAELRRCAQEGLCEGVVVQGALAATNEGRAALADLGQSFAGPILVESGGAVEEAAALGRILTELGPQFAARLPFAASGVATLAAFKLAGVRTNAVGCTTPEEALAAARAGASWVSPALTAPIVGTASGADFDVIRKTRSLLKAFELPTLLLVGPLRDASPLFDVTFMGAHATLASPAVLREIAARRHAGGAPSLDARPGS
jgi:transaldolase